MSVAKKFNSSEAAHKEFHAVCEPSESLKTRVMQCNHCTFKVSDNSSELFWHLCNCTTFGEIENGRTQEHYRRNCPISARCKTQERKRKYDTWFPELSLTLESDVPVVGSSSKTPADTSIIATKKNTSINQPMTAEAGEMVTAKIVLWAFKHNIPWTAIDTPEFREMLKSLNPEYKSEALQRKT
jgi:hypothetical protein